MEVPITQFRREIFDLMNRAKQGETISVTYKGGRFLIVPEPTAEFDPATRFDQLTTMQIVNPAFPDLDDLSANEAMLKEMEEEWEKDWAEL